MGRMEKQKNIEYELLIREYGIIIFVAMEQFVDRLYTIHNTYSYNIILDIVFIFLIFSVFFFFYCDDDNASRSIDVK